MKITFYIMLFFCLLIQAAYEEKEAEQETIFQLQMRARLQREQSIKFYAENRWIKQAAILKKLKSEFDADETKIPVVFAKQICHDDIED